MAGEQQPYISIETSGDDPQLGAVEAAQVLDELVQTSPVDTVSTIARSYDDLVNPAATTETVATEGLTERQQVIAKAIVTLLGLARHGRDVNFDEATYDSLFADPVHEELVAALNRTPKSGGKHENPGIYPRRRAIAVSGIRMVALTLSAAEASDANDGEAEVA